jgi:hypothetical protein
MPPAARTGHILGVGWAMSISLWVAGKGCMCDGGCHGKVSQQGRDDVACATYHGGPYMAFGTYHTSIWKSMDAA